MCRLFQVSPSSGNVQSDQCFAGSRHTCDEANEFASLHSRLIHQFFNTARSDAQVLRARIVASDSFDRMLSIKSSRGFHDGGCRMIRSARPLLIIEHFTGEGLQIQIDRFAKTLGMHQNRAIDLVVIGM